jgi:hypothetical protein
MVIDGKMRETKLDNNNNNNDNGGGTGAVIDGRKHETKLDNNNDDNEDEVITIGSSSDEEPSIHASKVRYLVLKM